MKLICVTAPNKDRFYINADMITSICQGTAKDVEQTIVYFVSPQDSVTVMGNIHEVAKQLQAN